MKVYLGAAASLKASVELQGPQFVLRAECSQL